MSSAGRLAVADRCIRKQSLSRQPSTQRNEGSVAIARRHIPRADAAEGIPAAAQLKRPLREPSGHLPAPSSAMSTRPDTGQRGMQPHTWGTVSSRAGAAPWLRAVQPNVWGAGHVFHTG